MLGDTQRTVLAVVESKQGWSLRRADAEGWGPYVPSAVADIILILERKGLVRRDRPGVGWMRAVFSVTEQGREVLAEGC